MKYSEIEAREECARCGIDPDEICVENGLFNWMVVNRQRFTVDAGCGLAVIEPWHFFDTKME